MYKSFFAAFLGALACAPGLLFAQTKPAAAEFEVASIKSAPPIDPAKILSGQLHVGMSIDAARVDIGNLSLADLIRIAYSVKPYQVVGPDWMSSQRFDILAKMPQGASKEQVPGMLQALLADRFKLAVHHDAKEQSVYALIVGKNGPKMKEAAPEPEAPSSSAAPSGAGGGQGEMVIGAGENQIRMSRNGDKGVTVTTAQTGKMNVVRGDDGAMRMDFEKITMPVLTELLARFTDRPVIDMTELKGNYQVSLELSMEELMNVARAAGAAAGIAMPMGGGRGEMARGPADAAAASSGSSIFTAVQQLGLKLDARKAPTDTIVVDHLEKLPTEN